MYQTYSKRSLEAWLLQLLSVSRLSSSPTWPAVISTPHSLGREDLVRQLPYSVQGFLHRLAIYSSSRFVYSSLILRVTLSFAECLAHLSLRLTAETVSLLRSLWSCSAPSNSWKATLSTLSFARALICCLRELSHYRVVISCYLIAT